MKAYFTPVADEDIEQLTAYLEPRSSRAAQNHVVAILTTARSLEEYPLIGRPGRVEDTRELPIPGTDYLLVYEISSSNSLHVLRVLHGKQKYPP